MTGPLTPPGFAPTGARLRFETADFSHFEGGLLSRHTVVLNMLDLARQIGAVPQSGTLGGRVGVWMQHVAAFWARARQARVPLRQCALKKIDGSLHFTSLRPPAQGASRRVAAGGPAQDGAA